MTATPKCEACGLYHFPSQSCNVARVLHEREERKRAEFAKNYSTEGRPADLPKATEPSSLLDQISRDQRKEAEPFPVVQHGLPSAEEVVALMAQQQRREAIRQRTIQPNISRKDARKRNAKRKQAKLSRNRNRRRK